MSNCTIVNMSKHTVTERVFINGERVTWTYQVELAVDVAALVKTLGIKAALNRTGKAQTLKGAIKMRRLSGPTPG